MFIKNFVRNSDDRQKYRTTGYKQCHKGIEKFEIPAQYEKPNM